MPVLHICGNVDDRAGNKFFRRLAPFLIIPSSADAYQHLSAGIVGMVDMPVIAARRLECDIEHRNLLVRQGRKIALTDEELTVGIRLAYGEEYGILILVLFGKFRSLLVPYFLCKSENRPAFRSAAVHRRMCDYRRYLVFCDTVSFCVLQMV